MVEVSDIVLSSRLVARCVTSVDVSPWLDTKAKGNKWLQIND